MHCCNVISDIVLPGLAILVAAFVGYQQVKINRRMLNIDEQVDFYLCVAYQMGKTENGLPIREKASVEIRNISAIVVSVDRYIFNGLERKILPYRLPPAAQFPNAYFYIDLPHPDVSKYASFELFFTDGLQRKWSVKGYAECKDGDWEVSSEEPVLISV